jgi:hypothetical protein
MSLHSRPILPPKTLDNLTSSSSRTHSAVLPEPHSAPPRPTASRPTEADPNVEPKRPPETRAEPATAEAPTQPWYRREPWLAVMLAAFVPLAAAVFVPDPARYPLIGLTGLALVVGAVMLVRQGIFGPPTGSGPSRH